MTTSSSRPGHFCVLGASGFYGAQTVVALADRDFDEWASTAIAAWSELSDAVIAEFADGGGMPA